MRSPSSLPLLAAAGLTLALAGCDKKAPNAPAEIANASTEKEAAAAEKPAKKPAGPHPGLLDPAQAREQAPAKYTVKLHTTKGDILIDVTREWAPLGADRFYNLVKVGYYDNVAFFRVISGFMAQVGISGDPKLNTIWRAARIKDDPAGKQSNTRGMVTFATAGPNTRTTQVFINFGNNANLDSMGFAPIGKVRTMKVVNQLYSGYGEGAPRGRGPGQGRMQQQGNSYLKAEFPELDYIEKATIEP